MGEEEGLEQDRGLGEGGDAVRFECHSLCSCPA